MRIPPDLTALLIKVRDFVFVFGPLLLITVTIVATLLALFGSGGLLTEPVKSGSKKWGALFRRYLEAGAPDREKLRVLFEYGFPLPPPKKPVGVGKVVVEGGEISASVGALLTATVLSPVLVLVRLVGGLIFIILGRWLNEKNSAVRTESATSTVENDLVLKPIRPGPMTPPRSITTTTTSPPAPASSLKVRAKAGQSENFLGRFWHLWTREFDYYLGRAIYNFLLAALVTIFVPLRLIESWFGAGQWTGPLLIPLVGLLLRPGAPGSETALVLALFIKGAGTGSGAAALLAFPLINLIGLAQRWQYYGSKPTLRFVSIAWLVASGTGLLLEIFGVNANV